MLLGGIITSTVAIGLLAIGLMIASTPSAFRDKKKLCFSLICFLLLVWVTSNYLSDLDLVRAIYWIRISFASIVVAVYTFLFFGYYFPVKEKIPSKVFYITTAAVIAMVAIVFMPAFIKGINVSQGISSFVPGSLYWIFVIYFFALFIFSFYRLIKRRRVLRGKNRQQVTYVLVAILSMATIASVTNLLLPSLVGNNDLYQLGSASSVIFVGLIGYSMVRHKLFDIRLVVARTLAYLLTLVAITGLYAAAVFGAIRLFFANQQLDTSQSYIYIVAAVFIAFIYQPVKSFLDRITDRIFFRHEYDAHQVLDSMGDVTTNEIDLNLLANKTLLILRSSLKVDYVSIFILPTDHNSEQAYQYIEGDDRYLLSKEVQIEVFKTIRKNKGQVIVSDQLETDSAIQRFLNSENIAVTVRLDTSKKLVGYMLLGPKQNGNAFSAKDTNLLSTAAYEIALGVQNSLRFKEIESFNITLQQKVDEATSKLRISNQKLKTLDETKDDFISMASHQLRTPLTSVKGYVSMVLDGDAGEITPMQRKLLTQSFISSQRMVYLIADLLNISRLKTGKFVIEPVPTNLAEALSGEVDQLMETAKGRNLELIYHKPDNFPTYLLDETKVRQVMMNFMDNAIYYTPSGGHIVAEVKNNPNNIEFTVSDDGIGVPKDQQHHLFSKFYRAPNALRARPDGTGLGLYMAKKVVLTQGGSIIFKSVEGKGSTFGFSFSKTKLAIPEAKKPNTLK